MSNNIKREAITKKSRARRYAMQCTYQYLLSQQKSELSGEELKTEVTSIIEDWFTRDDLNEFDVDFFKLLFRNSVNFKGNLDLQIAQFSSRPVAQLGIVEHAILLISLVELNRDSTPAKIIINEAIILAKQFAGEDSHKFINGILDKIHKQK